MATLFRFGSLLFLFSLSTFAAAAQPVANVTDLVSAVQNGTEGDTIEIAAGTGK